MIVENCNSKTQSIVTVPVLYGIVDLMRQAAGSRGNCRKNLWKVWAWVASVLQCTCERKESERNVGGGRAILAAVISSQGTLFLSQKLLKPSTRWKGELVGNCVVWAQDLLQYLISLLLVQMSPIRSVWNSYMRASSIQERRRKHWFIIRAGRWNLTASPISWETSRMICIFSVRGGVRLHRSIRKFISYEKLMEDFDFIHI